MAALLALGLILLGVWVARIGMRRLGRASGKALASFRKDGAEDAKPHAMTEAQARALLGVKPGASEKAVRAAYVRLIRRIHPDLGGTEGLAAELNAARDRLIG